MTHKIVEKALRNKGWICVRQTGSHRQYKKEGVNFVATVSIHGNGEISKGVLRHLEKGTGLSFL